MTSSNDLTENLLFNFQTWDDTSNYDVVREGILKKPQNRISLTFFLRQTAASQYSVIWLLSSSWNIGQWKNTSDHFELKLVKEPVA